MATTIPAIMTIIQADDGGVGPGSASPGIGRRASRHGSHAATAALTATQRTAAITALLAGTVTTLADVLALIATAAVAPVTQQQIWRLITNGGDATNG